MNEKYIGWIDKYIENILARPSMYGTNHECIELQIITLLHTRFMILNFEKENDDSRNFLNQYIKLISEEFKKGRKFVHLIFENDMNEFINSLIIIVNKIRRNCE